MDASRQVLLEQSLRMTPAQRFKYAMGLAHFALQLNPNLMKNRTLIAESLKATSRPSKARRPT